MENELPKTETPDELKTRITGLEKTNHELENNISELVEKIVSLEEAQIKYENQVDTLFIEDIHSILTKYPQELKDLVYGKFIVENGVVTKT